ncbi:MAG: hypothetical protein IKG15_07195, partial [Solobacterium sp.]|nr:hypothetical protein [Solobacterium sp.]
MEKKNLSESMLERMRTGKGKVCRRILVGITAFATAYSLITPASTLNAEEAEENGLLPEKTSDVTEEGSVEEPVSAEEETPVIEEEPQETAEPAVEEQQEISEEQEIVETEESAVEEQQEISEEQEPVETQEPAETQEETVEPVEESGEEALVPERTEYVYVEEGVLKVTATLSDPAAVPDEAELVVTPVTADLDTYNYDAYMEALNNSSEKEYNENNTLLYDVAFMLDGEEFQPAEGTVSVTFDFLKNQLTEGLNAEDDSAIEIKHLSLADNVKDNYKTTSEATDIVPEDIKVENVEIQILDLNNEITEFNADSFSVYSITNNLKAEQSGYTVRVRFFDYNGIDPSTPTGMTENYYVRIKAKNKTNGEEYYAVRPISLNNQQIVDMTVTGLARTTEYCWGGTTPDTVPFGSDIEVTDVRIITSDNIYNYETADNANDTIEGYKFQKNEEISGGTEIDLQRWNGSKLFVNVSEVDGDIAESDGYWILVEVDHRTTGKSYFAKKLDTSAAENGKVSIEVDEWRNQDGNVLPNEKFTGNETAVTVSLLKNIQGKNPSISDVVKKDANSVTLLTTGQFVKNYKYISSTNNIVPKDIDHTDIDYYSEYFAEVTLQAADYSDDFNYQTILGPGIVYGVTADRFEQQNHDVQSNFATNYYAGNNQPVNPNLSGEAAGAVSIANYVTFNSPNETTPDENGKVKISDTNNNQVILYTDKEQRLNDSSGGKVAVIEMPADEITNDIVEPIIGHMESISSELAQHNANLSFVETNNSIDIDASGLPDNVTIYIDADELSQKVFVENANKTLKITKKPNQTFVFNFKTTSDIYLKQYDVSIINSDGTVTTGNSAPNTSHGSAINKALDNLAQHVVWNMPVADHIRFNGTAGMFLIPNENCVAETVTTANTGWLITDGYFTNKGGEWHYVYADLTGVDKVNINAKKTVDGETPEGDVKFIFTFEHYNPVTHEWDTKKEVENNGGSVTYTAGHSDGLNEGWNVFRIVEAKKKDSTTGDYTLDSNTYYAAVKYIKVKENTYVAGAVTYYKGFNEDNYIQNAPSASVFMNGEDKIQSIVFVNNTTTQDKGSLTITKSWTGDTEDLTEEYKKAIKFTVTGPANYREEINYSEFTGNSY